jgi:hypothetical protein
MHECMDTAWRRLSARHSMRLSNGALGLWRAKCHFDASKKVTQTVYYKISFFLLFGDNFCHVYIGSNFFEAKT